MKRIITRENRGGVIVIEYEDELGNQWATQFQDDKQADAWTQARGLQTPA
ncbi:MAG: hypothetical protein ACYTEQ_03385 [Planctomycetota bacterium]